MRLKDKTCNYPICKRCGSNTHVRKKGFWDVKLDSRENVKSKVQRFHCSECDFHFIGDRIKKIPDFNVLDDKYKD